MFIELLRKKIADLTLQRDAAVDKIDAFAATLLDEKRDATDAENTEMVTLRDQAKSLTGEISDLRADLDERLQIDAARKASAKFDAPAITGRAGGGGELAGERGLAFYIQRTAIEGSRPGTDGFLKQGGA